MPEQKFKVDPSTIRSKEQYEATVAASTGCGCPWCQNESEQKSPIIKDMGQVVVRENVFPKSHRKMFLIHPKRHVRGEELNHEEAYQVFQARHWLEKQSKGGAAIHRFGDRQYNASSLSDDHYFESVVVPDGTGPVAETLFKDTSPEKVKAREERAQTFDEK